MERQTPEFQFQVQQMHEYTPDTILYFLLLSTLLQATGGQRGCVAQSKKGWPILHLLLCFTEHQFLGISVWHLATVPQ